MAHSWSGIAAISLVVLAGCAAAPARFDVALIGDQQYNAESEAQFPHLMAALDESGVAFVVHVGDFKNGTTMPCDDRLFESRLEQFDASRHPFIYTPGDNEWTDEDDAEFRERNAANLAWLAGTFAIARREGHRAVALFTQANPRFEFRFPRGRIRAMGAAPPPDSPNGFTEFLIAPEKEVVAFQRPVVLFHGDSHYFRVDKPLFRTGESSPGERGRQIENFTRVEVYGFPDAHWLRIMIDPASPGVFAYREEIVEKNRFRKP